MSSRAMLEERKKALTMFLRHGLTRYSRACTRGTPLSFATLSRMFLASSRVLDKIERENA